MRILFTALLFAGVQAGAQSDSASLFLQKGLAEKEKGRTLESWKAFDKAYSYNKTDKAVVQNLADALFKLNRYAQAREKYLELEKLGDNSPALYTQLMLLSFNMRQFPDAIKYAHLVKKLDNGAKTAYYIGKAYYEDDNYGEAIKFLKIAEGEDPQKAETPYLIARAYADMSNYKLAMPYFEKALTLDPANTRWMYETGLMYYAMRDNKASLKWLLTAAEKGYKRDNEYLENLAIAYLNNKEFDKGLEIMKEGLSRRPTDMNLLGMMAEASYDAKKYDDAIGYWDQILALDKTKADALYMIGMSYQKKGEKAKGQAICDKAIELDPALAKNKQKMEMPGGL